MNCQSSCSDGRIPSLQEIIISKIDQIPLEGIEETLPNGMKIYIEHRDDPYASKHFFSLSLVVKTGHCAEKNEEQQMAHFVEHCVFQGTEKFSWQNIEELKAKFKCATGADSNATTDLFETTYFFKNVPTNELTDCLNLVYELVFKANFPITPDDRLTNERDRVVTTELIKRRGPAWKYCKHSHREKDNGVIAHLNNRFHKSVKECNKEELRNRALDFYKKWYTPDRMCLVVVGDFKKGKQDLAPILEDIRSSFGKEISPVFCKAFQVL
jgi:zinc protease